MNSSQSRPEPRSLPRRRRRGIPFGERTVVADLRELLRHRSIPPAGADSVPTPVSSPSAAEAAPAQEAPVPGAHGLRIAWSTHPSTAYAWPAWGRITDVRAEPRPGKMLPNKKPVRSSGAEPLASVRSPRSRPTRGICQKAPGESSSRQTYRRMEAESLRCRNGAVRERVCAWKTSSRRLVLE